MAAPHTRSQTPTPNSSHTPAPPTHVVVPEEAVHHVPHAPALVDDAQQVGRAPGGVVLGQQVQEEPLACAVREDGAR